MKLQNKFIELLKNGKVLKELIKINEKNITDDEKELHSYIFLEQIYKTIDSEIYYKEDSETKNFIKTYLMMSCANKFGKSKQKYFNKYFAIIENFQIFMLFDKDYKNREYRGTKEIKNGIELAYRMKQTLKTIKNSESWNVSIKDMKKRFRKYNEIIDIKVEEEKSKINMKNMKQYFKKDKQINELMNSLELLNTTKNEINRFQKLKSWENQEIEFGHFKFGDLDEIAVQDTPSIKMDKFYSHLYQEKEFDNVIDEVTYFGIQNQLLNQNFSFSNMKYNNLYSNIFMFFIGGELKYLNEKEQKKILIDIKKIVLMMSNIHKAIISQYPNLKIFNDDSNKIFNDQSFYSDAFSGDLYVNDKDLKILKNGWMYKNLKDAYYNNINVSTDSIHNSFGDKDDSQDIKMQIMKKKALGLDDDKFRKNSLNESIEFKKNMIKNNPLINVYQIFSNFIINYDKNIINGKYNRPIIIFEHNLKDISKFIKEMDYKMKNNQLLNFLINNLNFYSEDNNNLKNNLKKYNSEINLHVEKDEFVNNKLKIKNYDLQISQNQYDWRTREERKVVIPEELLKGDNLETEMDFF